MFYLVQKPACSLEALCTDSTDRGDLRLVATGELQANTDQDIWDYTAWRLYADHYPSLEEVFDHCTTLADPRNIDFVFIRDPHTFNPENFEAFVVTNNHELTAWEDYFTPRETTITYKRKTK
ncbi:MAG TPA: hypothetical protein VFK06_24700 [Candidatus Angelobacter sp.]|nr:hypothetical protein [Candidatus Angelobacter sp.]